MVDFHICQPERDGQIRQKLAVPAPLRRARPGVRDAAPSHRDSGLDGTQQPNLPQRRLALSCVDAFTA